MMNKLFMLFAVYGVTTFYLPDVRAADPPPPRVWQKHDLGTLRSDNSGYSYANVTSADGSITTGSADVDSLTRQLFTFHEGSNSLTGLSSLKTDNTGYSSARGISADGRVIVGLSDTDSGYVQAFVFYKGDNKMTALGTLKTNNTGISYAEAVSVDGRVIVGNAQTDTLYHQAFVFHEGDSRITSLGTLKTDNTGASSATALSANGRVITGNAETDNGAHQAFAFYEGDSRMTGLGTLKTDNTGYSFGRAVSANGRVIVGEAETESDIHQAFVFYEGDSKMAGLGTLKANNTGISFARAVSADGRVIIGQSETDNQGDRQAFVFSEGESKMTSLGSLKADNTGYSFAEAISADGKVIVGVSRGDDGDDQAFAFHQGNSKMTGLGTLRTDNKGPSAAQAVSSDGLVVTGVSVTDIGEQHATLWKVKLPDPPEKPGAPKNLGTPETPPEPKIPQITIVDVPHSRQAMAETGKRGFKILDLYQSALNSLGNSRCQIGQSDYCVGVFSQMDIVNSPHRMATGLFSTVRLPDEHWMVGGAINFANNTQLIDNYDTRGNSRPGVGLFTRYQENRDNQGLSLELSGAFLSQGITVTRDRLANTEAGKGDSTIKGYQARLSAEYGFLLGEKTLLSPVAALAYHNIVRDGYTEHHQAEFPATYGRMGNKRTDLQLGANAQHRLTDVVQLDGGLGANVKLNSQRDAFTGRIDYIGAYAYNRGNERDVNPYAYLGVNVSPTVNSTVRANVGWQQTDYRNDAAQIGLSYSYHW